MSHTATSATGDASAASAASAGDATAVTTARRLPRQVEMLDGEIVADSGGSR
jgi:hypothetical protein